MADLYRRKPTTVPAWRHDPLLSKDQWPQWLQDYEVSTLMGLQRPGRGAGVLLVPSKSGNTMNVPPKDWVVLEEGVIHHVKDQDFGRLFEVAPEPEEAPAEEA